MLPLHQRLSKPVDAEIRQEQAEGRHHRDQAKVARGQQPRQNNGRDDLDRQSKTSGKDRHPGASHRETS